MDFNTQRNEPSVQYVYYPSTQTNRNDTQIFSEEKITEQLDKLFGPCIKEATKRKQRNVIVHCKEDQAPFKAAKLIEPTVIVRRSTSYNLRSHITLKDDENTALPKQKSFVGLNSPADNVNIQEDILENTLVGTNETGRQCTLLLNQNTTTTTMSVFGTHNTQKQTGDNLSETEPTRILSVNQIDDATNVAINPGNNEELSAKPTSNSNQICLITAQSQVKNRSKEDLLPERVAQTHQPTAANTACVISKVLSIERTTTQNLEPNPQFRQEASCPSATSILIDAINETTHPDKGSVYLAPNNLTALNSERVLDKEQSLACIESIPTATVSYTTTVNQLITPDLPPSTLHTANGGDDAYNSQHLKNGNYFPIGQPEALPPIAISRDNLQNEQLSASTDLLAFSSPNKAHSQVHISKLITPQPISEQDEYILDECHLSGNLSTCQSTNSTISLENVYTSPTIRQLPNQVALSTSMEQNILLVNRNIKKRQKPCPKSKKKKSLITATHELAHSIASRAETQKSPTLVDDSPSGSSQKQRQPNNNSSNTSFMDSDSSKSVKQCPKSTEQTQIVVLKIESDNSNQSQLEFQESSLPEPGYTISVGNTLTNTADESNYNSVIKLEDIPNHTRNSSGTQIRSFMSKTKRKVSSSEQTQQSSICKRTSKSEIHNVRIGLLLYQQRESRKLPQEHAELLARARQFDPDQEADLKLASASVYGICTLCNVIKGKNQIFLHWKDVHSYSGVKLTNLLPSEICCAFCYKSSDHTASHKQAINNNKRANKFVLTNHYKQNHPLSFFMRLLPPTENPTEQLPQDSEEKEIHETNQVDDTVEAYELPYTRSRQR